MGEDGRATCRSSLQPEQPSGVGSRPPGQQTTPHYHLQTEEIYYILVGQGLMRIDREERQVAAGDAIAIPPGKVHTITNTGSETLKFLCCCAPAYEHGDTVLVE